MGESLRFDHLARSNGGKGAREDINEELEVQREWKAVADCDDIFAVLDEYLDGTFSAATYIHSFKLTAIKTVSNPTTSLKTLQHTRGVHI